MLLMLESGLRGEIATISHPMLKPTTNIWVLSSILLLFISYLDANNLNGWAMPKQLPTSGFKWMADNELEDWKHMSCVIEFDLEYPEDLHRLHIDYPLAPERVKIGNVEKLIQSANNKTNYVVHFENLKLYEAMI